MQVKRRRVLKPPVARKALVALLMVAFSGTSRADGGAAFGSGGSRAAVPVASGASASPPAAAAVSPRSSRRRPARHLTVAQKIDEDVRRLTRGLKLDPGQQQKLRQILVEQHRQIVALRSGDSAASPDVAGTTLAIYGQTKARIRAMLNDEQKKKYSADVPRAGLAPAQADLKHWMDLQESKRRQEQAEGHAK